MISVWLLVKLFYKWSHAFCIILIIHITASLKYNNPIKGVNNALELMLLQFFKLLSKFLYSLCVHIQWLIYEILDIFTLICFLLWIYHFYPQIVEKFIFVKYRAVLCRLYFKIIVFVQCFNELFRWVIIAPFLTLKFVQTISQISNIVLYICLNKVVDLDAYSVMQSLNGYATSLTKLSTKIWYCSSSFLALRFITSIAY